VTTTDQVKEMSGHLKKIRVKRFVWKKALEEVELEMSTNLIGLFQMIANHRVSGILPWQWNDRNWEFTPAQFNKWWESFSHQRKIEYVQSLIQKG
jgi:hypothetical protein